MKEVTARRIVFFIENDYEQDIFFYTFTENIDDIELDEICLDIAEDYNDDEDMYPAGYWEEYVPEVHNQFADNNTPIWKVYKF
jgi:hypothetical protein